MESNQFPVLPLPRAEVAPLFIPRTIDLPTPTARKSIGQVPRMGPQYLVQGNLALNGGVWSCRKTPQVLVCIDRIKQRLPQKPIRVERGNTLQLHPKQTKLR
jgi:hypothetical protein